MVRSNLKGQVGVCPKEVNYKTEALVDKLLMKRLNVT
jgi:hypothetical protein